MKLTQAILDELKHQADRQSKRNYKCVEVDFRTVFALVEEIERVRSVCVRCENAAENAMRD